MPQDFSRRRFLAAFAAAGIAAGAAPAIVSAADAERPTAPPASTQTKRLGIGVVGLAGRGLDHVREILPVDNAQIVALCDVDALVLVAAARLAPKAAAYVDFIDLLKHPGLDAVVIATPDHNHALITAAALRAGKHVYCEKPLCHTISEVRAIDAMAKQSGLVTQMGIQIHSMANYPRVVEAIQSGAIGPVHEVHIWNTRPPRPINPAEVKPPPQLNYDLWIAPLAQRPFHPDFHPFNWRAYWAFGEAMLGDIGCHLMDIAFWSLDLGPATRVEAEGAPLDPDVCPDWIIARYDFAARGDRPPVKLTWYDNPKRPAKIAEWNIDKSFEEAVLFIGENGMLATDYSHHQLLPADKFKDFKPPVQRISQSPGHSREWINACLKNDPSAVSTPFSYGALLTETALLGTIAFRSGKALDWDAQNARFPNAPEAESMLQQHYRDGWSL